MNTLKVSSDGEIMPPKKIVRQTKLSTVRENAEKAKKNMKLDKKLQKSAQSNLNEKILEVESIFGEKEKQDLISIQETEKNQVPDILEEVRRQKISQKNCNQCPYFKSG